MSSYNLIYRAIHDGHWVISQSLILTRYIWSTLINPSDINQIEHFYWGPIRRRGNNLKVTKYQLNLWSLLLETIIDRFVRYDFTWVSISIYFFYKNHFLCESICWCFKDELKEVNIKHICVRQKILSKKKEDNFYERRKLSCLKGHNNASKKGFLWLPCTCVFLAMQCFSATIQVMSYL